MSVCQVGDAPQKKEERRLHYSVPDFSTGGVPWPADAVCRGGVRGGVRVSRSLVLDRK